MADKFAVGDVIRLKKKTSLRRQPMGNLTGGGGLSSEMHRLPTPGYDTPQAGGEKPAGDYSSRALNKLKKLPSRRSKERRLGAMVAYNDLFSCITMICSVITLVITIFMHKK